ncbi:MAG: hypothetical protein JSR59_05530 [Proteobacteria bacterium]|nr:hypothetical protein [Pseudomonadota bacterium]
MKHPQNRQQPRNQGEGDKEAARRYNRAEHAFVDSGRVDAAAHAAPPRDAREAADLERAEAAGRAHAKGEDPTVPGANKMRHK